MLYGLVVLTDEFSKWLPLRNGDRVRFAFKDKSNFAVGACDDKALLVLSFLEPNKENFFIILLFHETNFVLTDIKE